MNRRLQSVLGLLGLLNLFVIVSLVPELIGGDVKAVLEEKLGGYYGYVVATVGVAATTLYVLWGDGSKIFAGEEEKPPPQESSATETFQSIRAGLRESYEKRIYDKLATRCIFRSN